MRALGFLAALIIALPALGAARADDYRFGPQDRLRIKIVEWRAGEANYHEWEAMTGEYAVSADGSVSLPLIGSIKAEGRTGDDLAQTIADRLRTRATLAALPDVSVEVAQFRPIFVVGDVEKPGAYDFRPGLTVLQAMSLAGGLYRPREAGLIRLERDAITARGQLEGKRQELLRALAKRARVQAETEGAATIEPIEELVNDPDAARLIADEAKILQVRSSGLASQLQALDELQALLRKEIVSLQTKVTTQDAQIATGRRELDNVMGLMAKGLTTNQKQYTLEWQIADLQGRKIDLETQILRAQQDISKAQRDAINFKNEYAGQLTAQGQEADADIDQLRTAVATQRQLIAEASVSTPQAVASMADQAIAAPDFFLVRRVDGAPVETPARELDDLRAGDVLRVRQRQPGGGPGDPGSGASLRVTQDGARRSGF